MSYPAGNAGHHYAADNGNPQRLKHATAMAGRTVQRASLKEKLEAFRLKVARDVKQENVRENRKEEML